MSGVTVVGANTASGHRSPSMDSLWRNRTFLVLFLAEAQSIAGDQLARVALSVLVFERTNSATATALTYAATFLPAILGGSVLAGVGDRLPRRSVMVACDLLRTGLVGGMVVPGAPTALIVVLLCLTVVLGPVFTASQVGVLSLELDAEQFRACSGVRLATSQVAQVGGFALGGVVVAWLSPSGALAVDAASYLLSALVVGAMLRAGRERAPRADRSDTDAARRPAAWRWLWSQRALRPLVGLAWLAGFFVVPEGLAVPVTLHLGGSRADAGVLLAAIPLGGALGALVLLRAVPVAHRQRVAGVMAVLAGVPLVAAAWWPPLPLVVALWAVSGFCAAYQVEVTTAAIRRLPEQRRSELIGVLGAGLITAQGLGLIVFGLVAQVLDPAMTIGVAGGAGTLAAAALLVLAVRRDAGRHRAGTAYSA